MTRSAPDTNAPNAGSSPNLARVSQGDLCAGCGACAAIAPGKIQIQEVAPGYLRPHQTATLTAQEDATLAKVCPGLGQSVALEGRQSDDLWGPYIDMMTGHATDPELRYAGASGGALSAVLVSLLKNNTVDAVLQITADPDRPIGNTAVVSRDRDAILAATGSRYAPSAPLMGLQDQLDEHHQNGTRFVFVGKPCDAAALAAWRAVDPQVAAAFPVIVSFFCAGIPSFNGVRSLLKAMNTSEADTAKFRYRGNGWPGFATATDPAGATQQMSYHDSWGNVLSKHVQHRCKICADGTGVAADIVSADAWESDAAGYPVFTDAPGTSLIVARTGLGASLIQTAQDTGHIITAPFDITTLAAIQPGQRERRRGLFARIAALKIMVRPVPQYRGLQVFAAARQNSIRKNLKNTLGMLRRILRSA
jgi:coenzyme F420 hydrogenase subunit beta